MALTSVGACVEVVLNGAEGMGLGRGRRRGRGRRKVTQPEGEDEAGGGRKGDEGDDEEPEGAWVREGGRGKGVRVMIGHSPLQVIFIAEDQVAHCDLHQLGGRRGEGGR